MRITINRQELHDIIFDWYESLDDLPPHPIPDTGEHMDDILLLVDGHDGRIEQLDSDGKIYIMSYSPNVNIIKQRNAMRLRGKKTNAQYNKEKRSEAAKKAWETKRKTM